MLDSLTYVKDSILLLAHSAAMSTVLTLLQIFRSSTSPVKVELDVFKLFAKLYSLKEAADPSS